MADRFPKDNSYPEVPFGNVGLWPGAGVPLPNFIAREKSLRGHVLTGRFWASISESWRTRLGHKQSLTTVHYAACGRGIKVLPDSYDFAPANTSIEHKGLVPTTEANPHTMREG